MSATTPGAHLIYAIITIASGVTFLEPDHWIIALSGSAISAVTLALMYFCCQRISRKHMWATLFAIPVFTSQYFLLPAAFLTTDGLSYLFIAFFLAVTQTQSNVVARQLTAGLSLSALVLVRQIYLPASIAMMLLFASAAARTSLIFAVRHFAIAMFPLIAFLPFYLVWNGLTPPEFAKHEAEAINIPAVIQSVALLGFFVVPLLPALWRFARQNSFLAPIGLGILIAVAVVTIFSDTSYNPESGRFGSMIWTLSRFEHSLIGASISVIVLSVLGASALVWALTSDQQTIRIFAIGFIIYSFALGMQSFAWQRYSEVACLMMVSMLSARYLKIENRVEVGIFSAFFIAWFVLNILSRI
ncbi:MAG: hypothetical protein NXH72_14200 [Hyphomonadaceae bacterium]|nr:hypothetical protein [Hyphomonadaceae bacterium]